MTDRHASALAAEQAVLGALLADSRTAWPLVATVLRAEDFCHGVHPQLFAAISELCRAGGVADPISVADALRSRPAERVGGVDVEPDLAYLAKLARDVLSVANAGEHAAIVRREASRAALRRELLAAANELDDRPPSDVAAALQRRLADAMDRGAARSDVTMLDAARQAFDEIDARLAAAAGGRMPGISTGLPRLDRMLGGGLEPGLIVLAALTSAGKTALSWSIDLGAAERGEPVGIVSLEMTARELALRAFARVHGVPLGDLRRGDADAMERLVAADRERPVANLPVWIDDSASTIDDVCARIATWRARHGIRLAVVDYLQLVEHAGAETRQLEVAKVSRALKRLSLQLGIPVLALSQFNRAAASSGERPELHHLRDSGSVEQDSDVVLVLWRTAAQRDADRQDRAKQLCLTVLKARNGIVGDVYGPSAAEGPLVFEGAVQRFREYSEQLDGRIDGGEGRWEQPQAAAQAHGRSERAAPRARRAPAQSRLNGFDAAAGERS